MAGDFWLTVLKGGSQLTDAQLAFLSNQLGHACAGVIGQAFEKGHRGEHLRGLADFAFDQHEHLDALVDLLQATRVGILLLAAGRVLEVPGDVFASPGQGAALEGGLVAQGDHVIELLAIEALQRLAVQAFRADAQLLQGLTCTRINLTRQSAGAKNLIAFRVGMA